MVLSSCAFVYIKKKKKKKKEKKNSYHMLHMPHPFRCPLPGLFPTSCTCMSLHLLSRTRMSAIHTEAGPQLRIPGL